MSNPIHEVRLRVVQQITLRVSQAKDKLAAECLARAAANTLAHYRVQDQEIPVVDQYVEGIQTILVEEKS